MHQSEETVEVQISRDSQQKRWQNGEEQKSVLIFLSACKQGCTKITTEEKAFSLEHILSGVYRQRGGRQQWMLEQHPQLLISVKVVGRLQLFR